MVASVGALVGRRLGSDRGGLVVEVRYGDGTVQVHWLFADRRSFMVAVLPAVLALEAIIGDDPSAPGVVPHDRHVQPSLLFKALRREGVTTFTESR
jgi:hypothetical protein